MNIEKLIIGIFFGIIAQIVVFFQLQGSLKYDWFKNNYWLVVDDRQIKRWKSFTSRHSGMLRSQCAKSKKDLLDESFGLKTKQGLLHWSYRIK